MTYLIYAGFACGLLGCLLACYALADLRQLRQQLEAQEETAPPRCDGITHAFRNSSGPTWCACGAAYLLPDGRVGLDRDRPPA